MGIINDAQSGIDVVLTTVLDQLPPGAIITRRDDEELRWSYRYGQYGVLSPTFSELLKGIHENVVEAGLYAMKESAS